MAKSSKGKRGKAKKAAKPLAKSKVAKKAAKPAKKMAKKAVAAKKRPAGAPANGRTLTSIRAPKKRSR